MSWDPLWKDLCHELANGMAEIQGNPSADMKRVCNPVWTHWSYRWGAGMLSLVVVTLYVGLGFFFFFFHQRKAEETRPEGDNLSQVEEWWLSGESDKWWNFCQVISVSQAHFTWKQSGRLSECHRHQDWSLTWCSSHQHHTNSAPLTATALNWQKQCVLSFWGCFLWGCGHIHRKHFSEQQY